MRLIVIFVCVALQQFFTVGFSCEISKPVLCHIYHTGCQNWWLLHCCLLIYDFVYDFGNALVPMLLVLLI